MGEFKGLVPPIEDRTRRIPRATMPKPRKDEKVAVSYPHPEHVSAAFMRSMLHVFRLDAVECTRPDGRKAGGHGRIIKGGALFAVQNGAVVARGRNSIARQMLDTPGVDWLWMIDTDMTFDSTIVEDLIEAAHPTLRPIVGGLCFSYMADRDRKLWPTLYAWVPGTERLRRLTAYPRDTLIQVGATGAACLLVHRSVLEKIREKFPPPRPWFDETPFYALNDDGTPDLSTGDEYSEDLTFCLRAQACGFPVHVHTGIRLGHMKAFEANEDGFLTECALIGEAIKPALPTYAVIASKNHAVQLATLREQLTGQLTGAFVYDNGYETPPPDSIEAHGWPLHRMWNDGMDRAEKAANGKPFNVLIINDDVEVPLEMCAQLEMGLRQTLEDSTQEAWISYPNYHNLPIPPGTSAQVDNAAMAGQTISGWCFMLRGEAGLRYDEDFAWWYGDTDLEHRVRMAGHKVACVGGCFPRHLHANESTFTDPVRLQQAWDDEIHYAEKWGLDPETLFLHVKDKVPESVDASG